MWEKIWPFGLLFLGESIYILAETWLANTVNQTDKLTIKSFGNSLIVASLSGSMILLGYYFGYKVSKNIWYVSVVSISAILITEPLLNVFLVGEWPRLGSILGFGLAVMGLLAVNWFN